MGWLSGYLHRKPIPLTGGSDGAFADFQLKLAIAFVTDHMQSDFDDLRFTTEDGETLIDAWLEEKTDGTSADVWVEFPSTPADGVQETKGYMYYGKSDAVNYWDIGATFVVGDDFEDGTVGNAPAGWVVTDGTPQVQNDQAKTGSKSLKIGITAHDAIYKIFGTIIDKTLSVDFDFRTNATNTSKSWSEYEEGNSAYPYGPYSAAHTNEYFVSYYDGAYHNMETYNANQWYAHQMRYDASVDTFDWIIDSTAHNDVPFRNAKDNIDKILFENNQSSVFWIDNFRARKYAASPPTYEFGSEENAPTGLTILDFERPVMRGIMRGIMRGVA